MSAQFQEAPRIRQMLLTDLDAVIAIEREVLLCPWTPGNFCDSINSGYYCYVLEDSVNYISGYGVMTIALDEAHILTLSIAAGSQRKGCGKILLQHFIHVASKHHMRSIFLEVRTSNLDAARLYERLGFRQIGVRKEYYPAMSRREDAVVMELIL